MERHAPRWVALDRAACASKQLYNAALAVTRHASSKDHTRSSDTVLDTLLPPTEPHRALPAKGAQGVVKPVCRAGSRYCAAWRAWEAHPEQFLGHPKLPTYLPTKQGRYVRTDTTQALSRKPRNAGWMVPAGLPIRVATTQAFETRDPARSVPQATPYTVAGISEPPSTPADITPQGVAGRDLGVNNWAVVTSNQPGFVPLLVNGRPLQALHQRDNQRRAHYHSVLPDEQHT
jgi:putative transposase